MTEKDENFRLFVLFMKNKFIFAYSKYFFTGHKNAINLLTNFLSKKNVLFDLGNKTRGLDFKYGENTRVDGGCAALLEDKMMYFGGMIEGDKRQVSL